MKLEIYAVTFNAACSSTGFPAHKSLVGASRGFHIGDAWSFFDVGVKLKHLTQWWNFDVAGPSCRDHRMRCASHVGFTVDVASVVTLLNPHSHCVRQRITHTDLCITTPPP